MQNSLEVARASRRERTKKRERERRDSTGRRSQWFPTPPVIRIGVPFVSQRGRSSDFDLVADLRRATPRLGTSTFYTYVLKWPTRADIKARNQNDPLPSFTILHLCSRLMPVLIQGPPKSRIKSEAILWMLVGKRASWFSLPFSTCTEEHWESSFTPDGNF